MVYVRFKGSLVSARRERLAASVLALPARSSHRGAPSKVAKATPCRLAGRSGAAQKELRPWNSDQVRQGRGIVPEKLNSMPRLDAALDWLRQREVRVRSRNSETSSSGTTKSL